MAIYHFNIQNISIGKGKTAVAAAAYRNGEQLYSEKQDKYFYYQKEVPPVAFILKPEHAPEWCLNRQRLWNEVEKRESSKNGRYAKEFNVALPIELSDDEQEILIQEYCQKTFVDDGMVADIAIHRNDKNNPHAHVMLTNRPFNPDGTWGNKSKIEYILDKNGQKTYTKNGNVRKKKIPTVNWDDEKTLIHWRHEWADFTNRALERKGFTERISAESYETQEIEKVPTIHEGVDFKSQEKKAYNTEVKKQEKMKDKLKDTKNRIETYERFDLLTKNLSPKDRHRISELSSSLRTFINFQNIEDKKRMINNWKTSTYVKRSFGVDVAKTFQTIGNQEKDILEADKIMTDMSRRLIEKEYPFLSQEALTDYEMKWIADKTIKNGILTQEEIKEEMKELRPHLLEKQILLITKQPFTSWVNLESNLQTTEHKIVNTLKKYGRDIHSYQETDGKTPEEFYQADFKRLGFWFKDLARTKALKEVITTHYDDVLSKAFPDAALSELSIVEKENVYNLVMYYNPAYKAMTLNELMELSEKGKFTKEEKEAGLRFICTGNQEEIKGNQELSRIMSHEAMKNMLIIESMADDSINPMLIERAKRSLAEDEAGKKQYIKSQDSSLNYPVRKTVSMYRHFSLLLDVGRILFPYTSESELSKQRARNRKLAELEWSLTRKNRVPHR